MVTVVTPTGTGWVDSAVTDSLEYMYSYLPSWISFMVDRSTVRDSAGVLIGAVHDRWAALPPSRRPAVPPSRRPAVPPSRRPAVPPKMV